jgi:hypothetical protein
VRESTGSGRQAGSESGSRRTSSSSAAAAADAAPPPFSPPPKIESQRETLAVVRRPWRSRDGGEEAEEVVLVKQSRGRERRRSGGVRRSIDDDDDDDDDDVTVDDATPPRLGLCAFNERTVMVLLWKKKERRGSCSRDKVRSKSYLFFFCLWAKEGGKCEGGKQAPQLTNRRFSFSLREEANSGVLFLSLFSFSPASPF